MKAYALHLGDTRVPFGQFYGGGDSARDMIKVLRDRSHPILVPVYAFLVDHPRHGPIMIDTGLNWQQAHAHRDYYSGPLLRAAFEEGEYLLRPEQRLDAQLERIGVRPRDIGTVILTHLHEDHLGGVRDLLGARFLVSRADWTSKNLGLFPFRRTPSLKNVLTDPELIDFDSGPFHSFAASRDVFGDGSVVLLPTPGHSVGHTSVFVDGGTGWQLLCAGDTLYTVRHLASDQIRPIMLGRRGRDRQLDAIARIRALLRALPELIIAPGHDHTDYGRALEQLLAGPVDPGDAHAVRRRADALFDQRGRLSGPDQPRYCPDPAGGPGGVSWAEAGADR
ncbi:N-acyl homoserine lactonase family protein [Microlunatus speluncae]|uniref:N-acyl homoserine lactonase family protein n=1 Tax=Microlunatus speluncae TaxID=2594267 RepID=UPI0012663784|nr:N-acyl homoserine lactonase family protein [Microlunatus speluncae]